MKKTLSVVIALAMIASLASVLSLNASAAWDGTAKTAFSGAGTAEDPYKISSPEELAYLAAQVNGGENYSGKLFVQTADIDLGGREWTPIGSAKASAFGGVYDGNGHKITGLSITDNTLVNAGLFGFIHNAEAECGVMNLSLKGKIAIASPTVAVPFIGGLAGQTEGLHDAEAGAVKYWVKLINIENDVEIDVNSADTQPRLGGIVGQATSTYFEYAVNKAKISTVSTNVSRTGGIVGQCTRVSFIACRNDGDVTSEVTTNAKDCQVAGITSVISSYGGQGFLFRYCVNNGKITGISEKAAVKNGGIFAGTWDGTNPKNNDLKTLVSYCANNGAIYSECKDVTKNDCTGGLVSYVTYGGVTIENSVNASADIVSKGAFGTTQGKIGGICFNLNNNTNTIKDSKNVTATYYVGKGFNEENVQTGLAPADVKPDVDAILSNVKAVSGAKINGLAAPVQEAPTTADRSYVFVAAAVVSLAICGCALRFARKEN